MIGLRRVLVVCVLVGTACGCAPKKGAAPAANPCGDNLRFEGHVTIAGEVVLTKGAQPYLAGMIVGQPGEDDWVSKVMVLEGDKCIYVCEPQEQCMAGGEIPVLSNIQVIREGAKP